jgi:hypothetical protein
VTTRSLNISTRAVFAATWIPVLTFGAILTIPVFVGVLGKYYGMSDAALGRLSSAEFFACIVGTYVTNRKSIEQLACWVPWACVLAGIANVAGAILVSRVPLILFHPLGAFGAGVSYGYVLKVIDVSGKQERHFGTFMALFNLTMLGEFQLITYTTNRYLPASIFIVYAILAFGALFISIATRASLPQTTTAGATLAEVQRQTRISLAIIVSILALGVSYTAYGMIWPFVQLMGVTRGFSALNVANGLSACAVTAIFGSVAAATLTPKVHRAAVFSIALCTLLGSIYMMYAAPSYRLFFIGCAFFGFYWNFYLTLHLGMVARADNTGRGIVLCAVAPSIGTVIGSFLGGMLVEGANYLPSARTGSILCIIGIACTLATMARMKPVKMLVSTPHVLS